MNAPRKAPNLTEKLASALLELQRLRGVPIDREAAKLMSAGEICSLFQYDHAAGYVAHGAGNHPTGLTPMLTADHREKTRTDVGKIAKSKRISADHEAFRARMLAKLQGDVEEVMTRPKLKPKIASRGFDKTRTKKFNGKGSQP